MTETPDMSSLLAETRERLKARAAALAERRDAEIVGEAHEGQITVRMAGGRITEVRLDPRAARLDNATLGDAIRDAMNVVLARRDETTGEQDAGQVEEWAASLADVQGRAEAMLASVHSQMAQSLDTARAIAAQHAGRAPDPGAG